jgi:lipopolysaccharide biosynthesis glycosyltransferase
VTIRSILHFHGKENVVVYILVDTISKKNKRKLNKEFGEARNLSVQVIPVDDKILRELKTCSWSIYTWYRILLPTLLPKSVHRVLYLDADILVNENLSPLFELEMKNVSVAGTLDFESFFHRTFERNGYPSNKGYICSGVLLMNMDYWRDNLLAEKIIDYAKKNPERIKFPDQDSINVVCQDTKVILPLRYGFVTGIFSIPELYRDYPEQVLECYKTPAIVHYAGTSPWIEEFHSHPYYWLWKQMNENLKCPVRSKYITKGINLIKFIIYRALFGRNDFYKRFLEQVEYQLNTK